MIKKLLNYLLLTIAIASFSPILVMAQNLSATGGLLEIVASPENPEPGQPVTLTLNSLSYDLDRLKITWSVDGQNKSSDFGLKTFSVQAGKNGQKTTVRATVDTATDGPQQAEIFIVPSIVDLVYESLAYTPPFYKGKALNPNQGTVIVVAFPELIKNGVKLLTQNIIYTWEKNGVVQGSASGLGKNTFIFSGSVPIRDAQIKVTVTSIDRTISASREVNIPNIAPKIIFYEDSPVYGIMFNKAIVGTVRLLTDEFKAISFPYFMSVGYSGNQDLNYKWSVNGTLTENLDTDRTAMVFRQEGPGAGSANINLRVENLNRIFQFGENGFVINFEKQ
jgi:hypothetical protein